MWVVLVAAVVAVRVVGALDTSNLTGDAILNRILDEVLEDVPEPRFGISRTQWVMTGSMSETWSQYSSTSGSTFVGGVAEYYGAGAAASISGPDGIMRTRYNSLYPGFGFTGEWIMLPRQHKRFQYEIQYRHSKINVNVLMSQLWASVILRDNIVTVFGYILNRPSNFLSEELYTSLYHIYDAIRLRRVQIYGLIHVLQDVCFGTPTEQFLYIFEGLKMVVPRYLLGAVQIWIDTLRMEPLPLDQVMRPNGGPLVVDFLAGIEASVIRILREPIEWNSFKAPQKNAALSNLMGPIFVEIFAALEAGSLALTQPLFGLILINRPLNEVIPEKDETERYLVDILRLGNVESWENIIKPVTKQDRGDPEILIPRVLTQISISKETDVLIREEARYIIPYLKPPSNTYANKYYKTVSPVLSKPSIDLLLLLKSITKVEYPLEVVEDKDRIVHFILDGHLDIEFIVKGFNRFDHDTPINVLIALLTRIERRLPKLPPEIISSVRSLQLYLVYKRFLCSMSSTIPMQFLDISSLINAFANVRIPTHVYVLVQKLVVTLPYEDVPWRALIKEVSIEKCTRPRKCIYHFFKLVLEKNYITKGPSFKILVELMGYLNEDGDPWEMVTEESNSPKYCVPIPQTTQRSKTTTMFTKPWSSTWGSTRHTGHSSTPGTVTRHRTSTERTEPSEETRNTDPCDEDIFTMEATAETQPRRKHTTMRSTEASVSSTRHQSSTVRTEPTEQTRNTDPCDEDIFTMEATAETQPRRKHTTMRSTEASVPSTRHQSSTARTEPTEQTRNTDPCDEDIFTMEATAETQPRRKHTTMRSTEASVPSTRHRSSTVRTEPTEQTRNTEPCDEDIFTMEATAETQPRRKHTTMRSTEASVSSTRHRSSTVRTEPTEQTRNTDPCDEDIFTMEATAETQPRRKHTTMRSSEASVSTDGNDCDEENKEVDCSEEIEQAPYRTKPPSAFKSTPSSQSRESNTECAETVTDADRFSEAPRVTGSVETDCSDEETSTKSRQPTRTTENASTEDGDVECSKEELHEASTGHGVTKNVEYSSEEFDGSDCDNDPGRTEEDDVSCNEELTTKRSRQKTHHPRESEEQVECTDEKGGSRECGSEEYEENSDQTGSLDSDSEEVSKESSERSNTETADRSDCGEGDKTEECSEEEMTQKSRTTPRDNKVTKQVYPKSSTRSTDGVHSYEDECSGEEVQYSTKKFPKTRPTESTDRRTKIVTGRTRKVASTTTKRPRFSTTPNVRGQETTRNVGTSSWKVTRTTPKMKEKCYGKGGEEIDCETRYTKYPRSTTINAQKTTKKFSTSTLKITRTTPRVNGKCYGPRGEEIECSGAYSTEPSYTFTRNGKETNKVSVGTRKYSSTTENSSGTRGQHTYSTSKYVPGRTRSTGIASTDEESEPSTATTPEEELSPSWTEKSPWLEWSTPSRKATTTKRVQLTTSWTNMPRSTTTRSPPTSSWPGRTTGSSSGTRGHHTYSTSKYVPGRTPSTGIASTDEESEPSRATTPEEELSPSWTEKSPWLEWSTPSRKATTTKRVQLTTSWTNMPRSTTTRLPPTSSWPGRTTGSSSGTRGHHTYSTSKYVPGRTRSTGIASTDEESEPSTATTPEEELSPSWTEKSSWTHWSTPSRKATTTKRVQLTTSWTNIPRSTTTRSPPTSSWPGRTITWARNFTTTGLPASWTFPTRAQSTHTAASNSWTPWQKWTPTYSSQPTTNRADASTSRPHVEFTRTPATPPWQFNLNGSWSEWNGTFVGSTKQPPGGSTEPWHYMNITRAEVTTPRAVVLNSSWIQWNGTWSHWNFSSASFTTRGPHEGPPSWGERMPNITWPKLNFTSVVGFGAEMNWSLSYLLRESKIFTSEFVIQYVKQIHSTGRYSIQYVPTPQEIEKATFPSFDLIHSMEPPSLEHPETCLVPTQYGTLEDFKLKPLRFLLSSPELYQYLGPDFNPGKYSTKGELLLAILERFVQIQAVQTNTNIYSYLSKYINFIQDSKKSQGPSVTINFVSLLNALPFAVSEQEVRYQARITDFMSASEFYKILGPTFNPSKHKTRGPLLKYTFEFMMTLSIVQEDKFLLEALRYFVGKIYMEGYGGQAVEWVLIREVDQVQAVDVRSVFRAINHDKLSSAALQAESNVLNFIFNEFIPSVHFQDFKLSRFKTKGLLLQGAFRYLLTQNTVNPKVKADIITLMPYIRLDGPGVEPVDFDPFLR